MPAFEYVHKEGNVALSRVGIHYLEWGDRGSDVLIIHGITGMAIRWDRFARTLMDGFHVYALDLRGHGHSSWADSYTLDDYSDDIEELIESLGLVEPILVGHSLGGAIGMRFLGTRSNSVRKFLCVDMGPELPDDPGRRQRPRQDAPAAGNAEATLRFVKDALPAPENEDPEEYMYNHFKWSKHGDMEPRHDPGIFARLVDARASPWALWDEVRTIKIPTLVLRGETSRVLSREIADRMVREMADARLIEMPGTSHVLNVEDPENFNRIAGEFIRR